ncbi:hypothetical protein Lal_00043750 [Lupinus albus]|nr:hypothetical protein Lal_00043750 [Lupinus albus]
MNTRQFRGIRNNPSRHCEARQAPQQRTLFRGTGNRGHVADGLNHKRAMASTMFNRQKCTSGCLETCPFVLRPCPLEQHLAPHPSVQNGSHEKPRHVRGMPTTTHLGTVRPGRHLNRAHISEGRGDCRDDADGLNHYRAMASTMFNRQKCTSGCLDTCPFVLRLCPLRQHLAPHPSVQNGPHEKPRHVRGMPTTTHLDTVRPGRHLNRAHISEGRGDWRDVADCFNLGLASASTVLNRPECTSGCLGTCPSGTRRPTSFRAERVTLEASARPRDAHNHPSPHCEARPAPQQRTLFRGTRRLERRC